MPVGTRAAVRGVDVDDLAAVGAEIVLANTYHLMLRPGPPASRRWAVCTTSGDGADRSSPTRGDFRSSHSSRRSRKVGRSSDPLRRVDGRAQPRGRGADPGGAGTDIAMVLDVCVGLPRPPELVEAELERTLRWAERSLGTHQSPIRLCSGSSRAASIPTSGRRAPRDCRPRLPRLRDRRASVVRAGRAAPRTRSRPRRAPRRQAALCHGPGRYRRAAGGDHRGADLFDCVLPTRLGPPRQSPDPQWRLQPEQRRVDCRRPPHRRRLRLSDLSTHSRAYLGIWSG